MVYKFLDKKSKGSGISASLANKSANEPNYQLANELYKPIIIKLKKKRLFIFQRQYLGCRFSWYAVTK